MQGITLVSADELAHETAQRDREQTGLPPGECTPGRPRPVGEPGGSHALACPTQRDRAAPALSPLAGRRGAAGAAHCAGGDHPGLPLRADPPAVRHHREASLGRGSRLCVAAPEHKGCMGRRGAALASGCPDSALGTAAEPRLQARALAAPFMEAARQGHMPLRSVPRQHETPKLLPRPPTPNPPHPTPGPARPTPHCCRLLPPEEIQAWAARLQQLAPRLDGPVYFLWGTDSADVPVVNARCGGGRGGRGGRGGGGVRCRGPI